MEEFRTRDVCVRKRQPTPNLVPYVVPWREDRDDLAQLILSMPIRQRRRFSRHVAREVMTSVKWRRDMSVTNEPEWFRN